MPKRPTKTTERPDQKAQQAETLSAKEQFLAVVKSDNFRLICGILIAAITLFLALAYVSYFFTGARDISILQDDLLNRKELKQQILNIMGPTGARLSNFFIDKTFGVSFLAILVMNVLYSLHLLRIRLQKPWRVLFCSVFWLLWGSVTGGFLQQLFHFPLFFRLGGAHGEVVAEWLMSNIQWTGTLIVVVVVLLIFFILISDKTVPNLVRFWEWTKGLFHRKPKDEQTDVPVEPAQGEEQTPAEGAPETDPAIMEPGMEIDLGAALGDTAEPETSPAADDGLPFTIEGVEPADTTDDVVIDDDPDLTISATPAEAPTPDAAPADAATATDEAAPADPDLTIEKAVATETVETPETLLEKLGPYDPRADLSHFKFPSLELLKVYDNENAPVIDQDEQKANAARIVTTLRNYGVEIDSIKATVGPTVTLYEVVPKAGVRIAKIQTLENDIMLSLAAKGIRIIAPMPGKGTVGIEVPNTSPQVVSMHSVVASKKFQEDKKMKLPVALGRTITNDIFMFDLAKTPHLLVAGATGQGKSVAINAIITSLLYKKHPAEMKMVLVDPKMVEFSLYKPLLKHYLASMPDVDPEQVVITDCDKVVNTLNSLVIEMENRYKLLMDAGVRNLEEYNEKFVQRRLNPEKLVAGELHHQFLPYIVIVIDEYGDFIMQAGKQVETPIARITQKARAVGMHMILATQRPSVNIVTGVIKANIPTRIALRTQSVVDSRTVLDAKGADQLIGRGDLLYSGNGEITRIQCAFVDTPEVDAVVDHIKVQQSYFEPYQLPEYVGEGGEGEALAPGAVDLKKLDPMFREIATYVVANQQGSTSILQRKFQIGYNRAGKISDQLEAAGIVGPNKGPKGRDVLIQDLMTLDQKFQELGI